MALIMVEGFDHYHVVSSGSKLPLKGWVGNAFEGLPGRILYGPQSQCVKVILFNSIHKPLPAVTTDLVVGFAFQVENLANAGIFVLRDQAFANETTIGITADGLITVSDGASTFTGTHPISPNTWYYLELKLDSGTAEVHLNAKTEIGAVSGNFANDWYIVQFEWDGGIGSHFVLVDDFYMCDLTGPTNNDFLGDTLIETLYPISDGTYRDWTPDTGTDHFARVNELQIDEAASYVETAADGDKDSYNVGNPTLPAGATVFGVQLNLGVEKTEAGVRSINPLIVQDGTRYLGPETYIPTDWGFVSWLLDQDPTGTDWVGATVDGDEYGIEVASSDGISGDVLTADFMVE